MKSRFRERMILLNSVAGYLLLTIAVGCYLSIVLVEKDFTPSRFVLALNVLSGIIMIAVNQIVSVHQLTKNWDQNSKYPKIKKNDQRKTDR